MTAYATYKIRRIQDGKFFKQASRFACRSGVWGRARDFTDQGRTYTTLAAVKVSFKSEFKSDEWSQYEIVRFEQVERASTPASVLLEVG